MPTVSDYQPCRVPLKRCRLWDGITPVEQAAWVVVHAGAAASISRIEAKIITTNRNLVAQGKKPYLIRKGDTGAYNCRKTTSGRSWSKHSWGCAVDVNWQTNPYSKTLRTDMPRWFVQAWTDEGWGWGGSWSNVKDAMHFSKFPNEGGDGKLYVGEYHGEFGQENDVPTQKEWDAFIEADRKWKEAVEKKIYAVWKDHGDNQYPGGEGSEAVYKGVLEDVKQPDGKGLGAALEALRDDLKAHIDQAVGSGGGD